MRREGVIFLCSLMILTIIVGSLDAIFNTFALFLLAGIIPGTQFAFSSGMMFVITVSSLVGMIAWPFRQTIRVFLEKYTKRTHQLHNTYTKRRRFRHPIH